MMKVAMVTGLLGGSKSSEISPDFGQISLVLPRRHLHFRLFCPILVICGLYLVICCCYVLIFFFGYVGGLLFVAVVICCLCVVVKTQPYPPAKTDHPIRPP
jgi:hypothetical protein